MVHKTGTIFSNSEKSQAAGFFQAHEHSGPMDWQLFAGLAVPWQICSSEAVVEINEGSFFLEGSS